MRNKAVYLAIGVRCSGHKEVLGLWIEQTEGAKFWLRVMNDLKARGVQDILIAVVDGLKGFPDAITAVFPDTIVQTCIVHLIRNSIRLATWKERKPLAQALKPVYQADNAEAAEEALGAFENGEWGRRFPTVEQSWRRHWDRIISVLRVPGARAEDPVHDECDRKLAQRRSQEHPEQGAFPQRRGRHETDLAGLAQHHGKVEESLDRMGRGQGAIRDSVRRSIHAGRLTIDNGSHTKVLTLPTADRSESDGQTTGPYR